MRLRHILRRLRQSPTFTAITAVTLALGIGANAAIFSVIEGVLPILGVQPVLGRLFSRQDDSPGSPRTVILSYGYWQARFGGNASVLGRRILLDGRSTEIIGVLPDRFRFLDRKADLFLPMQRDRSKVY